MAKRTGVETLFFVLFLDCWQGSNTEFSSSSKNLDEGLAKLFDEIQLQVFSKVPFDDTRTAGYPQKESLKNTEFVSSSNQEEHLAKLFVERLHCPEECLKRLVNFDEILQQVFSSVPYEETRTAGKSVTERDKREGASVAGYSTEPRFLLGSMDRVSTKGHVSEKRNRKSFLFSRDINEQFSTEDNETLREAVRTDTQNKDVPCVQLLDFLQRNIIIAAALVAGILVVTVLLLLVLTAYISRKKPLYPPANMTYNIFILNGKTWWQKYQEKNPRKQKGKQKQLKSKSCV
ncbi:uncharacterized protein C2orf92 homolog isoform X1 [Herpailurus yagouaroundi]|uniref:uncharacterized protein C2orf92 homolog isoform X1 n=1 Tax=Herpailurus yagouaroundi TaxID=1608482 RepID=UPI001AD642FB|nr:uncharacterized protein C2orf92 homolog isoform X1 [Puma yagouaroundi]